MLPRREKRQTARFSPFLLTRVLAELGAVCLRCHRMQRSRPNELGFRVVILIASSVLWSWCFLLGSIAYWLFLHGRAYNWDLGARGPGLREGFLRVRRNLGFRIKGLALGNVWF